MQKNIAKCRKAMEACAEGYVDFSKSGHPYYYFRHDHLGDNREVWLANTNTVVQRTQYYPSGLPWIYQTGDNSDLQHRKYNGKEFVEMHGWDTYDIVWRQYYPAIMRFQTQDPYAEKYYNLSPYTMCSDNMVRYTDPDGRYIVGADGKHKASYKINSKGEIVWKNATADTKRIGNAMLLNEKGRKQLDKMINSDAKLTLVVSVKNKSESFIDKDGKVKTKIINGETVPNKNGVTCTTVTDQTTGKTTKTYKITSAKIIVYEGSIKESVNNSKSQLYGLEVDQAIGSVGCHEVQHATSKRQIQKDYNNAQNAEDGPNAVEKQFIDQLKK